MLRKLALVVTLLGGLVAGIPALAQSSNPSFPANSSGRVIVSQYANWNVQSLNSVTAGAQTMTLNNCYPISFGTGNRRIFPFAVNVPVTILDGSSTETALAVTSVVTPVAPVGTSASGNPYNCSFTATFANLHNAGVSIISGDGGLEEAINDALAQNIGIVVIDSTATITPATMAAAVVYPQIQVEDLRNPSFQYWNPSPNTTTAFAAPSALTSATAASSTTVAGSASYTGGTVHVCYALVDAMGNEGPCSADYSFTDTSAKAIAFTAPPAATGAVGYIPYIGLESGASTNEYQVLLYTQPTVLGSLPTSAGVCTLTTIETTLPACAITNATYGQTGSAAVVAAYPVVTSPQAVGLGSLGTASYYVGNSNSHTGYSYIPSAVAALPGVVKSSLPFHITTAAASTVPQILGTLAIPPGFMNYVDRTIEVCGYAYSSTQGASTVVKIAFEWDAQGSNITTGIPVIIGGPSVTNTLTTGTTGQFDFCQQFTTTVASATATGGTITAGHGYLIECALTTCATPAAGPNMTVAAVGSLNLAGPARLHVVMVQTTSSTAVPQLISLTAKLLN